MRVPVIRTRRSAALAVAALAAAALVSCSPSSSSEPPDPASASTAQPGATATATATVSSSAATTSTAPPGSAPASPSAPAAAARPVVGTVVRFTSPRTSVEVRIGEDSPASRDFLSMLPLTLPVEDLAAREKISYLPRKLDHAGTPGSDPEDGDLIYFTPWGNLGFYYDASGIDYADDTLHLGTYEATLEQLQALEDEAVRVEVVR